MYIDSLLIESLNKTYIEENFDSLLADYKPVKMQIAIFDTQEKAEKFIEDVNGGTTFDTAAVNNGSTNTPESSVYLDSSSSLNLEVKNYLNSTDKIGLSSIIPYTTAASTSDGQTSETTSYYVLNVESRDVNDFKEEYINLVSLELTGDEAKNYFFNKHDIKFYDQDIYKFMSSKYEVLK